MNSDDSVIWLPQGCGLTPVLAEAIPDATLKTYTSTTDFTEAGGRGYGAVIAIVAEHLHELDAQNPDFVMRLILLLQGETAVNDALLSDERVCAAVAPDSPRETLITAFRSALRQLRQDLAGSNDAEALEKVLEIGRALASEKNLDTLLDLVLSHARRLTGADGASIYTRDPNGKLYFRLWQNFSSKTTSNAQKTLAGDYSVAGYVARSGESVNIKDAYAIPDDAPYKFNPASDSSIGYRTRSMLTLPLTNKIDEVVGVLQLINRKANHETYLKSDEDFSDKVLLFEEDSIAIAMALAGQAGVALENSILYEDIEKLFEGFIRASVQAIEARDPTTAGHSFRVAGFTERLGKSVDASDLQSVRSILFSKDQMRELRYAALLHDFGKVGVRENVLVKANKLYPHQLDLIEQRFQYARTSLGRHAFRKILDLFEDGNITKEELSARKKEIEQMLADEDQRLQHYIEVIIQANLPTVLQQEASADLEAVAKYTFPDHDGRSTPLLEKFEFSSLMLSKGTLSPDERQQIESHVSHTFDFLSLIPWTKNLSGLPDIAFAHHEKLDGSGYPRGLGPKDIPVQSRIMTIADIFDALTAPDRPYKKAIPVERALDILSEEASSGKVDADLFKIFVESRSYLPVTV